MSLLLMNFAKVSIQLVSPASGEGSVSKLKSQLMRFPFN